MIKPSRIFSVVVSFIAFFSAGVSWASDPMDICMQAATNAARNVSKSIGSASFSSAVFGRYCYRDGSFNSSASGLDLSVVIPEINLPLGLNFTGNNQSEVMTAWCKTNSTTYSASSNSSSFSSTIASGYYGGITECVAVVQNGSYVFAQFSPQPDTMTLAFHVGDPDFHIEGIVYPRDIVTCVTPTNSPAYSTRDLPKHTGDWLVTCTRKPLTSAGTSKQYGDETINVSGYRSLSVYWPHDESLAPNEANVILSNIADLKAKLDALNTSYVGLKDEANFTVGLMESTPFALAGYGCPAHYTMVGALLVGHNVENGRPKENDPFNNAGLIVNNGAFVTNTGWSALHPNLCKLDIASMPHF